VFHEQLRIFAVQRHPINRRLVFVFLLYDAKEFVGVQPKRFPDKIIFACDANATRVPSGEISGNAPSAIFFECVPSGSATKIFSPRSYAILRCPALTSA
jgi:hypothetical protein